MAEGDFSPQSIGVRLLAISIWLGWTQRELGVMMGYTDAQISHCIHGRSTPTDGAMLRLIRATEISGDWIRYGLCAGLDNLHPDRATELLHYEEAAASFLAERGTLREARKHFQGKQ